MSGVKATRSLEAALAAVMTAATTALTMLISIPFAPTRGFFNLGDAMVMLSGLLFGARVGAIAGGLGSALADLFLGYWYFAPLTLFIKGTEGFLTGLIGYRRGLPYRIAAVIVGAVAMMTGYFAVEAPLFGLAAAIGEAAFINSVQVGFGAIVSILVAASIVKVYPRITALTAAGMGGIRTGILAVAIAAVALAVIVLAYLATGALA